MTQDIEIIKSNLEKYPFIKHYLGDIIDQRLKIECYTHGMLTANLLNHSKSDLERLNSILQLGETYCKDFKRIFKGKRLPRMSEIADAQIIDILAEVKAFEFLYSQGFSDITNVKRQSSAKTVDFIAKRSGQDYAVEATRLGLSQSGDKQPVYHYRVSTIDYTKCEDANGFEVSLITEGINVCRLKREISDAINHKYCQIRDFCQKENGAWKGILIISSGRDYFAMSKYENKAYEQTPRKDFLTVLTEVWKSLEQEDRDDYLHHVVITRGKDLAKVVIYPEL